MNRLNNIFGKPKPIIGMVHLRPLPGSPLYDPQKMGMDQILEIAVQEAKLLEQAVDQAQDDILKDVARLRLSAVQFQLTQYETALKTLQQVTSNVWMAQKLQLQANIELAQGDKAAAKRDFQQALELAEPQQKALIQLQLNNL